MKTTAGYLRAPWEFELRDVKLPDEPPAGEVLVRIEACGICGTDLRTAVMAKEWQPFGHEVAGVIEQVGPGVERLPPGQKVVLESSSFCGHCEQCRNGRVDLCNKAPNFWKNAAMGFSERMLAPACCVVPYEGLSPEVASLAEPAGVAFDMAKTAAVNLGERVALIGPGPIGLMAIPLLLRSGARQVVCIGNAHSTRRLEVARLLGAETLALTGSLDSHAELVNQFEHVVMPAPVELIPAALKLLTYGGELTYIGSTKGSGEVTFDANYFHYRMLQLRSSFASPALYFPAVLELLKADIIPGETIVSQVYGLAQLGEAMHFCRDDKASAVKVVVKP